MEGIWLELSTKRYEPLENSEWVAKGSEWGAGEEGAIIVISAEEVQGGGSLPTRGAREWGGEEVQKEKAMSSVLGLDKVDWQARSFPATFLYSFVLRRWPWWLS